MPNDLNWAGNCRGQIVNYSLWAAQSGAVAVNITARIDECWHDNDWQDHRGQEFVAEGAIWIVKIDGSLNQTQVEALVKHTGWDGKLQSIDDRTWEPKSCAFTTIEETYKEKSRCRISWIAGYDDAPGQAGNVPPEKLRELVNRHGSALRAIAGNLARNAVPPPAKPLAPAGPTGARRPTKNTPIYPDPNLDPPNVEDPSIPFENGSAEVNTKFDEAELPDEPHDPTPEEAESFWRAELVNAKTLTDYERVSNGMAADPFLTEASRKRVQLLMDHRLK